MSKHNIKPILDEKGLPNHGAAWGSAEQVTLRAVSRGPGVAVEVRHPLTGGPPRRVVGGDGEAYLLGGKLFVKPRSALAGAELTLLVEF